MFLHDGLPCSIALELAIASLRVKCFTLLPLRTLEPSTYDLRRLTRREFISAIERFSSDRQ